MSPRIQESDLYTYEALLCNVYQAAHDPRALELLRKFREAVRREALESIREREAACCPEDVPFDEIVRSQGARIRELEAALTFAALRGANLSRCETRYPLNGWSPTDWACALAGEVGEACNLIKKGRRGEPIERAAVAEELADAVIYIDLLAARLGIDLGAAVAYKFNRVSERYGVSIRLEPDAGRAAAPGTITADCRLRAEEKP